MFEITAKVKAAKKYMIYISTDGGSMVEAEPYVSLAEALADYDDAPKWVRDVESFERWLNKCGGYGFIEIDGDRVAEVRS